MKFSMKHKYIIFLLASIGFVLGMSFLAEYKFAFSRRVAISCRNLPSPKVTNDFCSYVFLTHDRNVGILRKYVNIFKSRQRSPDLGKFPNTDFSAHYVTSEHLNSLVYIDTIFLPKKIIYQQNDVINLKYRSDKNLTLSVYNVNSASEHKLLLETKLEPTHKARFLSYSYQKGFEYNHFVDYSIPMPDNSFGWYAFIVRNKNDIVYQVPFFIEKATIESQYLFIESTDTLQAYVSDKGFMTYYKNKPSNQAYFFRYKNYYPLNYSTYLLDNKSVPCTEHLIVADRILREGLMPILHNFDQGSDDFLENYENIKDYKMIILGAHNEYWSKNKFTNLKRYIDSGGHLLILGGNNAWRYVVNSQDGKRIFGTGSHFLPEHQNFILNYLGTRFNPYHYLIYSSFIRKNDNHFLTQKVDRTFGKLRYTAKCGYTAASGHETDKLIASATGFTILASGKLGGADIVFKKFPNGGSVLNFSSIASWTSIEDASIQNIIKNYIGYVTDN